MMYSIKLTRVFLSLEFRFLTIRLLCVSLVPGVLIFHTPPLFFHLLYFTTFQPFTTFHLLFPTISWCGHATYFSKKEEKRMGREKKMGENGMGRMNGRKVDELIRAQLAFFSFITQPPKAGILFLPKCPQFSCRRDHHHKGCRL